MTRRLVVCCTLFVLTAAARADQPAPPLYEMRMYRLSQLSEDGLRELRERSKKQFEERRRAENSAAIEAAKAGGAGGMWTTSSAPSNSEILFEANLLGQCAFVKTLEEARKARCTQ